MNLIPKPYLNGQFSKMYNNQSHIIYTETIFYSFIFENTLDNLPEIQLSQYTL